MACARNYFEMRAELVINYFTQAFSPLSFPFLSLFLSLTLFLNSLSPLSFILSCRKYDLSENSSASIRYLLKHKKLVNITSLWVRIGIRQTFALTAACYTLQKSVRCQEIQLPGKLSVQETITFIFLPS